MEPSCRNRILRRCHNSTSCAGGQTPLVIQIQLAVATLVMRCRVFFTPRSPSSIWVKKEGQLKDQLAVTLQITLAELQLPQLYCKYSYLVKGFSAASTTVKVEVSNLCWIARVTIFRITYRLRPVSKPMLDGLQLAHPVALALVDRPTPCILRHLWLVNYSLQTLVIGPSLTLDIPVKTG
ncbi:hypothetical protein BO83DRAFT_194280 [Aspergillus eucalypticola CBS 122712]|uniref:Uncharacterized protein n=1 Tax=Aspergillus eucalypticola (strain CBS 122712 / IBT 29274) TaxID=1448314 RepID=A0A317UNG6_ASPEC|nr:uncharacterized protein BO83DRAFT_194280 [Aspergillus eucalypticola CBS 122712]PWY62092.1 hypothetical protein BO83DRAFT_194280 [Aspergillus eucalypticola CBS 122712]